MTCAVSDAVRERRKGGDLRVDGQHGGERGGIRGARGHHVRGDHPRGADRARQARPDADPRRARDRAPGEASTTRWRSSARSSSEHPISLVNSLNEFRIEGQKTAAFELLEDLSGRARPALHPRRQRGEHHGLLAWVSRDGRRAAALRLPGRGRRAARARPSAWSTPKRSPPRSASAGRRAARRRSPRRPSRVARSARSRTPTSSPPTGCSRARKGCSWSRRRTPRSRACSSTAPTARAVSCACSRAAASRIPRRRSSRPKARSSAARSRCPAIEEAVLGEREAFAEVASVRTPGGATVGA